MILVPLIQPAIPYQGFNPALVAFQQIAIYLAEFDELQLVGNAAFQKWPVVGVGVSPPNKRFHRVRISCIFRPGSWVICTTTEGGVTNRAGFGFMQSHFRIVG